MSTRNPYISPRFDNEPKPHATDDTTTRTTPRDSDPVRQRLDFDTEYATQPMNDIRLDGLPPVLPLPPRPGSAQFTEAPLSSRLAWTLESMDKPDETSQRSRIIRIPQFVTRHFRITSRPKGTLSNDHLHILHHKVPIWFGFHTFFYYVGKRGHSIPRAGGVRISHI